MCRPRSLIAGSPSVFLFVFGLFASCYNKAVPIYEPFRPMIAATDDTIHNYAIMVLKNHRFAYTITYGNQLPDAKREFYHGSWKYRTDTLFLRYSKKTPSGMAGYLVKEVTGGWMIQFFTDGRTRIFLRVPR
jgi:hypothetical protein